MKKLTLSLVSILAMSGLGYAGGDIAPVEEVVAAPVVISSSAWFIGAMGGYENVAVDARLHNLSNGVVVIDDSDQDNLFFGLKLGYMFDFNHRIDIAAEKTNHSDGLVSVPISLNYTYVADYEMSGFHPLVGVGFGMVKWEETVLCDANSRDIDLDGTMWQVRAGLLYEMNQEVELEVYYRYSQAEFDTETCNIGGNDGTLDLDNVKRNGIFAGINYKF